MSHVLIVEDDIDAAQALALLVQTEGLSTAIAHSLAELSALLPDRDLALRKRHWAEAAQRRGQSLDVVKRQPS